MSGLNILVEPVVGGLRNNPIVSPWLDSIALSWTYSADYQGRISDSSWPHLQEKMLITASGSATLSEDHSDRKIQAGYNGTTDDWSEINGGLANGEFRSHKRATDWKGANKNSLLRNSAKKGGLEDWQPTDQGTLNGRYWGIITPQSGPPVESDLCVVTNGKAKISEVYLEQRFDGIWVSLEINFDGTGYASNSPPNDPNFPIDPMIIAEVEDRKLSQIYGIPITFDITRPAIPTITGAIVNEEILSISLTLTKSTL